MLLLWLLSLLPRSLRLLLLLRGSAGLLLRSACMLPGLSLLLLLPGWEEVRLRLLGAATAATTTITRMIQHPARGEGVCQHKKRLTANMDRRCCLENVHRCASRNIMHTGCLSLHSGIMSSPYLQQPMRPYFSVSSCVAVVACSSL